MAAPTIYKSTDGNAPVVNGVAGSFVDVLEKCLVVGYGDKPAAGWAKPYSNAGNTIACFRSPPAVSTGFYLQVDHGTINAYTVRMRAFENMTSEVDGVLKWADTSAGQYELFTTSTGASSVARPWVVIASDAWVFCTVYGGLTSMPATADVLKLYNDGGAMFFGDFDPLRPSDAYNCLFAFGFTGGSSGYGTSCFGSHCGQNIALNAYHKVARNITGVSGGELCGLMGGCADRHLLWVRLQRIPGAVCCRGRIDCQPGDGAFCFQQVSRVFAQRVCADDQASVRQSAGC